MRYCWGSDSCQRSPHRQVSPLATCHCPIVPPSTTWYAATPLYLPPQRAALLPGFATLVQARRHTPPKQVRYPTDRQFASGYSPPRLATTQLPSATELWPTPTVGMEVWRAQPLRVRWLIHRFPNGPQSGSHQAHVSTSPPFHPGRSVFPSPVGDHDYHCSLPGSA